MARKRNLEDVLGEPNLQTNGVTPLTPVKASSGVMAECERFEVWLHPDDVDAQDTLTKKLKRAYPPPKGYRFTRNTLLRVAVKMLLERTPELRGGTEEELLRSLGIDL